jgi:hypothetical protein
MSVLQGHVRDSSGRLVGDAAVLLQHIPETAPGAESRILMPMERSTSPVLVKALTLCAQK